MTAISKHALHKALKSAWSIAEPEWHPIKLKEAKWGAKGGLRLIFICHWDLVIPACKMVENHLAPDRASKDSSILGRG